MAKANKKNIAVSTEATDAAGVVGVEATPVSKYVNMTSADIFTHVTGGEQMRGAVSKTIRQLNSEGFSNAAIAKMLDKRYQHVRNVLTEPLKTSTAGVVDISDEE